MTSQAREATRVPTRIPVVLPHLSITIADTGALTVMLDKTPYDIPPGWVGLGRSAVPRIVDDITTRLASPVRVEVIDDGAAFTDIVTPASGPVPELAGRPEPMPSVRIAGEVVGGGFLPDEPVAVAVVVAHQAADASGHVRLRLPPALLAGRPGLVVLLGKTSGTIALSGGTP